MFTFNNLKQFLLNIILHLRKRKTVLVYYTQLEIIDIRIIHYAADLHAYFNDQNKNKITGVNYEITYIKEWVSTCSNYFASMYDHRWLKSSKKEWTMVLNIYIVLLRQHILVIIT